MKNVQLPKELFIKLIRYHLLDDNSVCVDICKGLETKLDTIMDRELYTQYKTASTNEEKEKARTDYLDRKGYHKDFRW